MVEAVARMVSQHPGLRWLMLHARQTFPEAELAADAVRQAISRQGIEDHVVLIDHFLPEDSIHQALQAMDLIVFPYQKSRDSASLAVRFGLTARRPVACTPVPLFAELAGVVHTLPGTNPEQLATGLGALLDDPGLLESRAVAQAEWLEEHAWRRVGRRLFDLCKEVAGG
jgi:glycosyltransferase involved in cell wall biosynthesis